MYLPSSARNALAKLVRSLPIRGRWRLASWLNGPFPKGEATFWLPAVGTITLDLSTEMQRHVYWGGLGRDDARIAELIRSVLPADGLFVDVGANIGIHALAAARHVAAGGGAVLAFEPHPANYELLLRNIAQNGLSNVSAERLGLADSAEVFTGASMAHAGNWSLASQGSYRFEVRLVCLDHFLRDNPVPRLDLLKIDVEGAEVRVLRGARETIRRFQPLIIFEVCPMWLERMKTQVAELFAELSSQGYTIRSLPVGRQDRGRRVGPGDFDRLAAGAVANLVAVPQSSPVSSRESRPLFAQG